MSLLERVHAISSLERQATTYVEERLDEHNCNPPRVNNMVGHADRLALQPLHWYKEELFSSNYSKNVDPDLYFSAEDVKDYPLHREIISRFGVHIARIAAIATGMVDDPAVFKGSNTRLGSYEEPYDLKNEPYYAEEIDWDKPDRYRKFAIGKSACELVMANGDLYTGFSRNFCFSEDKSTLCGVYYQRNGMPIKLSESAVVSFLAF